MNPLLFKRFFLVLQCLSVTLFGCVVTQSLRGQNPDPYQTGCGNSDDDDNDNKDCGGGGCGDDNNENDPDAGTDDDADDCDQTGANPINPYRANVHRNVTDITTFGSAPISFMRQANSRNATHGGFTDSYWELGYRQIWQHNWNYEMRRLGTVANNTSASTQYILLRYPNGNEYDFKPLSYPLAIGSQLVPPAWNPDRLYVTALSSTGTITACTLLTRSGEELDFTKSTAPAFHLIQKRDGLGNSWTCAYSSPNDTGQLTRITNNFGRWIQITRETGTDGVVRIHQVSTSDGRAVTYGYSQWASSGKFVLSSITYPGGEQATYTHVTSDPTSSTARPLISAAHDPAYRQGSPGAHIKYVYNYSASYTDSHGFVPGSLLEEHNGITDQTIIRLPNGGGTYPYIAEGDGTEITRKYTHGRLTTKRDGENRNIAFIRDNNGFGFVASKTDANGLTQYTRDYAGRILSRTDALNHSRSHTYNPKGFMLTATDELNHTMTWTRDSVNARPIRKDYPDTTYETWTNYNSNSQPQTHRLRNGATETFVYDPSNGNMTSRTDAAGKTWTYTYYSSGLVSSITDPRLYTTSYTYNWRGQIVTLTHPGGSTITSHYDDFGNRDSVTDELNHTTHYTYDEYNRTKTVTDPLARTTIYEYGRAPGCNTCSYAGTLDRVIYPTGHITSYSYDASGLRTCKTVGAETADAASTIYEYDSRKNVYRMTDPRGKVWLFGYDNKHRRLSATDPLGNLTQWSYDDHGNTQTQTRPDNGLTQFEYNERNLLRKVTDPAEHITEMTYEADNLKTIKDPRNKIYTFEYDNLNREKSLTYPDSSNDHEAWAYDDAGNVFTYTTRAGQVQTFIYDNRNRETQSSWAGNGAPTVTRSYDDASRLLTLNNAASNLTFDYDDANELKSETQAVSGLPPRTINYSYWSDSRRKTMTYPDGGVVNYAYTNRDQLYTEALDTSAPFVTYGYDLNDNRTSKSLDNSTSTAYGYDNANRLLSIAHQNGSGIFSSFTYEYNAVNNRKYVQRESGKGDVYSYDPIDQVTGTQYEATDPSGTPSNPASVESLTYDDAGNRMTQNATSYSANDLNQYTSVGSASPSYDSNGNLTGGINSGWNYQYDAKNRLATATSSGPDSLTVAYDGRNRPVKRTMGNTVLPTNAVSRKTHGSGGIFDIDLPLTGTPGIECRTGGATNDHQVVVTFSRPISYTAAMVSTGTGTVASASISGDAKEVTINLTAVSNAQTIVVKLSGVSDGTVTNDVLVGISVLLGDTTGNGAVNSSDAAQTQTQTGQLVTSANFREDVTANGAINSSDIATVQGQSGTAITTSTTITQPQPMKYLVYDGWNLIAEFDGSGTQVAKYLNGARIDEVIERVGAPTNVYYHHDALGSTMKLTSSAGAVVEQCSYTVFGSPTIKTAAGATLSGSAYGNRFLFSGRELLNTGLYDYRNRVYSPDLGRFLQIDPLGFAANDVNLYRYVKNTVAISTDPFGLGPEFQPARFQAQNLSGSATYRYSNKQGHKKDCPKFQCCPCLLFCLTVQTGPTGTAEIIFLAEGIIRMTPNKSTTVCDGGDDCVEDAPGPVVPSGGAGVPVTG